MKIVFTTYLPQEGFPRLQEEHLVLPDAPYGMLTHNELTRHLKDADILVATFDYTIPESAIQKANQLRLIANFGSGYNNLPMKLCEDKGIIVTNTPQPVIEPTAEHAWAMLHTLAHRTAELDRKLRQPDSGGIRFGVMRNLGTALFGKTLGIIGMGNIGQAIARRALASGMKIVYHNRKRLSPIVEKRYNATYVTFDTLLQQSDVVSLNLPYYPEVHHLISRTELAKMKPTALLLNTARGTHINEADLAWALQKGKIAGAALDVFEHEPDILPELLQLDNVVLSPHIGTGTWEGRISMCKCVEDNIINFKNNNINLLNQVTL